MNGLAKNPPRKWPVQPPHGRFGTDNFDRDFALSLLSSDQDAIYEIEEALNVSSETPMASAELTGSPFPHPPGGDSLDAFYRAGPGSVGT